MISKGLMKWIVAGAIALSAGTVVAGTVHRAKHSTPTHKTALVSTTHKATPAVKHTTVTSKKAPVATTKKTSLTTKKTSTKLTAKNGKTTKLVTHTPTKASQKKTTVGTPKKTYSQPLPLKSSNTPSRDKMPWVY